MLLFISFTGGSRNGQWRKDQSGQMVNPLTHTYNTYYDTYQLTWKLIKKNIIWTLIGHQIMNYFLEFGVQYVVVGWGYACTYYIQFLCNKLNEEWSSITCLHRGIKGIKTSARRSNPIKI